MVVKNAALSDRRTLHTPRRHPRRGGARAHGTATQGVGGDSPEGRCMHVSLSSQGIEDQPSGSVLAVAAPLVLSVGGHQHRVPFSYTVVLAVHHQGAAPL